MAESTRILKDGNGFERWQNYILEELKDLKKEQNQTTRALNHLVIDVAVLKSQAKVQGSVWGAIWGTGSAVLVLLFSAAISYVLQ